ncbi:MAG: stage 0 sporulation family protein [Clostridiales Family XIII bacterium]|jgi:cell fate regulator YaaT (PSP1 superfamily)|nr:stage 0 sporulation family protein [Clostridiales Family XIII bacterium]
MLRVIAVKFRTSQKNYYFDPGDVVLRSGDYVVVETSRGQEIGQVKGGILEVSESEFGKSVKRIKRKATDEDIETDRRNLERKQEAIPVCKQKIAELGLGMKLIDAEYTFDGSKLIFYFTAEKRVDFRDLVKDLAGYFHKRIELRQVGVRDEARLLGGFGSCGRELCCKGWLQEFEPVSIKMAKVQNLSLNPGKISGCCGRLMCCLKYENDVYAELKKGLPNMGEYVETALGKAKVVDVSIFRGVVRVRNVEEERTRENPERLSGDVFEYGKDEVRRRPKDGGGGGQGGRGGRGGRGNKKDAATSVSKEIADALKDELISVVVEEQA